MRSPVDFLRHRTDKAMEIPLERPDLLIADSKRRYKIAAACGVFGVANYIAATKNYVPSDFQLEVHIANDIAWIGGIAAGIFYGLTGLFQRFAADNLSFGALDRQFHQENDTSDLPAVDESPDID